MRVRGDGLRPAGDGWIFRNQDEFIFGDHNSYGVLQPDRRDQRSYCGANQDRPFYCHIGKPDGGSGACIYRLQ